MFMFAYYLFGMYIKTLIADFWLILRTVMTVLHYVYIHVYNEYTNQHIYIFFVFITFRVLLHPLTIQGKLDIPPGGPTSSLSVARGCHYAGHLESTLPSLNATPEIKGEKRKPAGKQGFDTPY